MKNQRNDTPAVPEKEKSFQRPKRMISAVVIAIIIWVLVVNVVNPEVTVTVTDVPVSFVGESYLRDRGFVVVDRDMLPEISLKVRGTRRALLSGMNRISVQVDVSSIDKAGKTLIGAQVNLPGNISVQKQKIFSVEINVEPRYEKTVPVVIEQTGDVKQKNKGKIVCSVPDMEEITVYGSVSDVEQIKKCLVTVDVSGMESDRKTAHEYRLIDSEGRPVSEESSAYCDNSVIGVTNIVYNRHTVNMALEVSPSVRREFKVEYDEKRLGSTTVDIGVADGAEVPKTVNAVLSDADYNEGKQTLELQIEESEGIYVPFKTYSLEAELKPMKEEYMTVKVALKNIPDKLGASAEEITVQRKVLIPADMTGDITATVDCSDFVQGTNRGRIKFDDKFVIMSENDDLAIDIKLNSINVKE